MNRKPGPSQSFDFGELESSRRDFLNKASCAVFAALAASGISAEEALTYPISLISAAAAQGSEISYALPAQEGVSIDKDHEVILVRSANRVYAFALACPHENTALRWRPQDQRFQCPRHQSKYRPDGTFLSGRSTRNMDRFDLHASEGKVVVDLSKLFRSDRQRTEWDAAVLVLS